MLSHFSRVRLCATRRTVAHLAALSMGFSRQEYGSGLPCPAPGDLPDPGIEPASLALAALAGGFFTTSATWEAQLLFACCLQNGWASLVAQMVKNLPAMQETQVQSLGQEDPLEKQMAIHSSILAWKIPCTEEPGRATVARVGYNLEAKPPPNMNDLNPNFCVVCQCFQALSQVRGLKK